jgi:hypothetical protein
MMNNANIAAIEFWMSVVPFSFLAIWYWVPYCRKSSFAAGVTPLLFIHAFRHMGLFYLSTAAVAVPPPIEFASPTAWGDVAAAVLAICALLAVRYAAPLGKPAVWLFSVVGIGDLVVATINSNRYAVIEHHLGIAYLLWVIVVPALLVSHILILWLLLRTQRAAE